MNAFDETSLKRALLARDFPAIWLSFRDAVEEAVESYNRLAEGEDCPINLTATETDKPMFLACRLGRTKKEGSWCFSIWLLR